MEWGSPVWHILPAWLKLNAYVAMSGSKPRQPEMPAGQTPNPSFLVHCASPFFFLSSSQESKETDSAENRHLYLQAAGEIGILSIHGFSICILILPSSVSCADLLDFAAHSSSIILRRSRDAKHANQRRRTFLKAPVRDEENPVK